MREKQGYQVQNFFCDDIRTEKDGRESFMGVFFDELVVDSFPFRINQLYLPFFIRPPVADSAKRIRIHLSGLGGGFYHELGEDEIQANSYEGCPWTTIRFNFKLEGLELTEKTRIAPMVMIDNFYDETEHHEGSVLVIRREGDW